MVLGARNLGGAIATHLQSQGWSVAAVARSDDSLAGMRSQRIHAHKRLASFQHRVPEVRGAFGVNEQLKGHFLARIASARDNQIKSTNDRITKLRSLQLQDVRTCFIVHAHRE